MTTKKFLEKKDWNYHVYEDDHTFQLSVPIPKPTPGFDVLHTLNESEKEQYLNKGITTLESRIEDMNINYSNYEMVSWR
ncbi:MAG: hypothetical protein EOO20_05205 [Chryseobacterium sp.]|nr:MAG: hypothetical protein EOO20_05205 [Chryseobacterium sp.]